MKKFVMSIKLYGCKTCTGNIIHKTFRSNKASDLLLKEFYSIIEKELEVRKEKTKLMHQELEVIKNLEPSDRMKKKYEITNKKKYQYKEKFKFGTSYFYFFEFLNFNGQYGDVINYNMVTIETLDSWFNKHL